MSREIFLSIFASVFLAEIGDKTQLATMLFAADNKGQALTVFLASAAALVAAAGMAVVVGGALNRFINPQHLKLLAGVGFIAIGIWTLWSARGE